MPTIVTDGPENSKNDRGPFPTWHAGPTLEPGYGGPEIRVARLAANYARISDVNKLAPARVAPPRLIETLALGFNLAVSAPFAVAIAAVLDIVYWLGPRLSLGDTWLSTIRDQLIATPIDQAAAQPLLDNIALLAQANLLTLLSAAASLGGLWPMGLSSLFGSAPGIDSLGDALTIPSAGMALLLVIALLVLGTLAGALYLVFVAARIRRETPRPERIVSWAMGAWGRILLLNAIVLLGLMILSVPFSLLLVVANMISPALGPALVAFAIVIFFLLWAYGWFTVPAIVLDEINPARAYWRSWQVVRRHFWPAAGLILLCLVLSLGFGELWQWLSEEAWAVPIAILGQAFLSTALTASMMVFYDTRKVAKS